MWKVLQQYFKERKKVDYELLRGVVKKHLKFIEAYYDADTEAAEQRSKGINKGIKGPGPKVKSITMEQLEKNDLLNAKLRSVVHDEPSLENWLEQ